VSTRDHCDLEAERVVEEVECGACVIGGHGGPTRTTQLDKPPSAAPSASPAHSAAFGGFGGLRVTPATGHDLPPPSSYHIRNSVPKCSITAATVRHVAAARAAAALRAAPRHFL
jgi:hypothetical protein